MSENRGIKFGDKRLFAESTITKKAVFPDGTTYEPGAIVRASATIEIGGFTTSVSLPSMAELIFHQSSKQLEKATSIKSKATKTVLVNGYYRLSSEEDFFTYIQLCCMGILGLYASIEAMVYELYLRRPKTEVKIDGNVITFSQLVNYGFGRKVTSIASQLSGKSNIYGTKLAENATNLSTIRTTIEHWDMETSDSYFMELPEKHPLKQLININPTKLAKDVREILDHYRL